ncbi:MAG: hypothetical protein ACOC44_09275 [Promethearchaeia archaeon]
MSKLARCPECAGKMKYESSIKQLVCQSCGLSLSRYELDNYWKKIKNQDFDDESEKKKKRRKDWLDWYSKSKEDKDFG